MRYQVQLATSVDVAFLAAVIDEDHDQWSGERDGMQINRLLQTCACSAQVWAARDSNGTPTALWGVTPVSDDPDVGHLWMLACETFDNNPTELESLSRLVFGEMLSQFPRLENYVDSRKVRAIELLRSIGFAVEPAVPRPTDDANFHRVWIDSDRLLTGVTSQLLN
ncbi:MAG: hypothetical protein HYX38_16520 [Rhodospirillales bacterium]|nr:hypothetical protein [Rhodospirillales bacterium]